MAVDTTPKLRVRQSLLAKIETTTGTAESLVADDGKFNIYNVRHSYDIPMSERPGQAGYGKLESMSGTRFGAIEFECDLSGLGSSGTAPYWATTFLPACGFTQASNVFSLAYNASQPTITIGAYIDGIKFALAGCAGTCRFPLQSGFSNRIMFRFVGKLVADADVALVTPTAFNTLPPRFAGNTVSIAGSYTPYLSQLEINANNTLQVRPFQGDITGGRACIITNRTPLLTLDPELQLVATRDWYTSLIGHTTESISVGVGTASSNIITFASTYAQWLEIPISDGELMRRNISGQLCRDHLTITFT